GCGVGDAHADIDDFRCANQRRGERGDALAKEHLSTGLELAAEDSQGNLGADSEHARLSTGDGQSRADDRSAAANHAAVEATTSRVGAAANSVFDQVVEATGEHDAEVT